MKYSFTLEPKLRHILNSKKARRVSFKKHRTIYNRVFRRNLKQNPEMDIRLLNKRVNYEY